MATNDAKMVTVAKPKVGGAIYRAPVGSTLPTDATTALTAPFKCLGYISQDGISNANSPKIEVIRAWGGDQVLHVQTERPDDFKTVLIEGLNVEVLKTVYGDDKVTGTLENGIVIEAGAEPKESAYVIEKIYVDGVVSRTVIPCGTITQLDEIKYKDNEPVAYGITISAKPSPSHPSHKEYIKKGTGVTK